jgi:hypothetical protein
MKDIVDEYFFLECFPERLVAYSLKGECNLRYALII